MVCKENNWNEKIRKKEKKKAYGTIYGFGLETIAFVECSFENIILEFRKWRFQYVIRWEAFGIW